VSHYDKETGLIKVSWSKIRLSEECRQKAWLVSEGKKSAIADARVFFQGNVVDQAMRQWLSQESPEPGWMVKHIDALMDETEQKVKDDKDGVIRWKHRDDRKQVRAFCLECAVRLEPILDRFALPFEYRPALRFATQLVIPGLDGKPVPILLNGEMDLLTKNIAQYRVWDLKVTKDAHYWRKTIAQLVFYDIVCLCLYGQSAVEVGLIQPMVDAQPWLSFTPSEEDRTLMLTRIIGVAHGIMRQDYSPKAGSEGCSWCECRNSCVKYAPEPGTQTMPLF
jgi:PD-(D/E)XK nuclease superfamily protein